MNNLMKKIGFPLMALSLAACADATTDTNRPESNDAADACVFCGDAKADAHGIARESYLAYGILAVANTATFEELDDEVPLDVRAARGIVADRPFEYIEQVDTVSYVGKTAFANLAAYAEDNGFVPFCGDGELQPLLEACDDGNDVDGDGCSATCQTDDGGNSGNGGNNTEWFDLQEELIIGADIGVSLVENDGYYLRKRNISLFGEDNEALEALLERADGINANLNPNADGYISWDELALLSKEPFYSTLLADERAVLPDAWEIMQVSTAPMVAIEYKGGPISNTLPFETKIERVGPLLVEPTRKIADLPGSTQREVSQRLQGVAGLNADNDDSTIELTDLEKGIEDLAPAFTTWEVRAMEDIIELMFKEATPSTPGDFAIEFLSMPNTGSVPHTLVEFDGWKFGFTTNVELHYDAYDSRGSVFSDYFDANMKTYYSFRTFLTKDGQADFVCYGGSSCERRFGYTGVKYVRLSGASTAPGYSTKGIMLMEHWKNGKRVYNRFVDFKNTYSHISRRSTQMDQYLGARPAVKGGSPLSLRKNGTKKYRRGSIITTYDAFKVVPVQTEFNRNLEKFFPEMESTLSYFLPPGRYEEFDGITLEIHESRAAIAYWDNDQCAMPFNYVQGAMETESCNGRKARITFSNVDSTLVTYRNGSRAEEIDIYDSNDVYNGYEYRMLQLDRSYYVIAP